MVFLKQKIKRQINVKFKYIHRAFGNKSFKLLDVGAGNYSASKTKEIFPNCDYYGLDLDKSTNYSEKDFSLMTEFYELDLTSLALEVIPNNYFDYINMAHVIEHLHNGEKVLPLLLTKLKPGGFFYLEYPGKKSLTLPSMHGTLNFYDDPTHVKVYNIPELSGIFHQQNCEIIKSGTRRNWYYIIATPFRVVASILESGKVRGNIFWDILGFAEFFFVRKMN